MDHEGAPRPLLFPAPPCHLRIINSRGAGGQIRAITHIGQADKTQTLSVTLHDICFSFHFRPREKSTCFISSMGSTQDPPLSVCHLLTLMAVRWLTVSWCSEEEWTTVSTVSFTAIVLYLKQTKTYSLLQICINLKNLIIFTKLKRDLTLNHSSYYALSAVTDIVELQIFHRGCVQNMLALINYGFISKAVVTVKQKVSYILYQVSRGTSLWYYRVVWTVCLFLILLPKLFLHLTCNLNGPTGWGFRVRNNQQNRGGFLSFPS